MKPEDYDNLTLRRLVSSLVERIEKLERRTADLEAELERRNK